jgi:hypothetical protein
MLTEKPKPIDKKAAKRANMGKSINPNQKKPVNYIDKEEFYNALVAYKEACKLSPDDIPRVPPYIGMCFIKIANGLASAPNFAGYSFRDDMVGEAIETCLRYVKSFDPEKSKQPFSYFTQCCWYVFIGRIQAEKKQTKLKRALVQYADFDTYALQAQDEGGEFAVDMNEFLLSLGPEEEPKVEVKKPVVGKLEGFFE